MLTITHPTAEELRKDYYESLRQTTNSLRTKCESFWPHLTAKELNAGREHCLYRLQTSKLVTTNQNAYTGLHRPISVRLGVRAKISDQSACVQGFAPKYADQSKCFQGFSQSILTNHSASRGQPITARLGVHPKCSSQSQRFEGFTYQSTGGACYKHYPRMQQQHQ